MWNEVVALVFIGLYRRFVIGQIHLTNDVSCLLQIPISDTQWGEMISELTFFIRLVCLFQWTVFIILLVSRTGTVGWTELWVPKCALPVNFLALTASITMEVQNNHSHVTAQKFLNKFFKINFSVGCRDAVYFKIDYL